MPSAHLRGRFRDVPGQRDGVGGQLACGTLGAPRIQDRGAQQRQERGERSQHEHRDDDTNEAGDREDADHEAKVDEHHPKGVAAIQPRLGSSQDGGSTAEDHGNQVGQGAEQELRGEPGGQRSDEQPQAVRDQCPRWAGGQHGDQAHQRPDQPDHGRHDRPRGIGRRCLGAGHLHQRPDGPEDSAKVCGRADRGQRLRPCEGAHGQDDDGADQDRKCLARNAFGALGDPGAQHRGPERDQRAHHGEADPAQQVERDVRCHQPSMPRLGRVTGQGRAQPGADRQSQRGTDVVAHGCPETRRQRRPGL